MAYAHQKGVIHRDMKQANLMIGDFGKVYVMARGIILNNKPGGCHALICSYPSRGASL